MKTRKPIVKASNSKPSDGALLLVNLDWKHLGRDLRARRMERNVTMRQIAEWHGLSHSSISRLELRGAHCTVETLLTLTIMLEVDLYAYVFATPAHVQNRSTPTLAAIMGRA